MNKIILKKIYSKLHRKFNDFVYFFAMLPHRSRAYVFIFYCELVCRINLRDKVVLKIGGKINPFLENMLPIAKRVINVDVSDVYISTKNVLDIKSDAHSLPMLADESVDFVASSHTIEHLTNPLKALIEWKRILRKGGIIYASLPYYKKTFDHNRKVTMLSHLVDDLSKDVGLDDPSHNEEFLKNFDIKKDFCFTDYDVWYKNYLSDPSIYTHFHVFDKSLVRDVMELSGYKTIAIFYNYISIEYFGIKQ